MSKITFTCDLSTFRRVLCGVYMYTVAETHRSLRFKILDFIATLKGWRVASYQAYLIVLKNKSFIDNEESVSCNNHINRRLKNDSD